MYLSVSSALSVASVVYIVCGIASLFIAFEFFLTKNGLLRKILIALFLSWATHYIVIAYLFYTHAPSLVRITVATALSSMDFTVMLALYLFMKWKH